MPGANLTMASRVQCPHGGQAILTTRQAAVSAEQALTLRETDIHTVAGCPFTVGTKYSPCVRIEWRAGAASVTLDGDPALVRSSVGLCYNAEGAVQGSAMIVTTQTRVTAR